MSTPSESSGDSVCHLGQNKETAAQSAVEPVVAKPESWAAMLLKMSGCGLATNMNQDQQVVVIKAPTIKMSSDILENGQVAIDNEEDKMDYSLKEFLSLPSSVCSTQISKPALSNSTTVANQPKF